MSLVGHYNWWIAIALMMIGFYPVIARSNLVKKVIGLSLFQTGILLFYISMGKVLGGTAPVETAAGAIYSNAIPHALILTAIVVSVSTMAVALAVIVCIRKSYGTIEADEIEKADGE